MWTIEKDFTFEASHQLPKHSDKCQRLHGHSWKGTLILEDTQLWTDGSSAGMVQDFGDISRELHTLLECQLDHWHLNQTTGLDNPTSEELARWIYNQLKPLLPLLVAVTIQETCSARATYRP